MAFPKIDYEPMSALVSNKIALDAIALLNSYAL